MNAGAYYARMFVCVSVRAVVSFSRAFHILCITHLEPKNWETFSSLFFCTFKGTNVIT